MDSPEQLSAFNDFCYLFLSIVLEGAPFIFFGTLVSGFIDAYLPPGLIDRVLPKNKPLAVFCSGLLGAVLPVCECAVVPVIRRLIRKGLPVSCAITYMLSAPIINPITVISTMNAFNSELGDVLLRKSAVQTYSPLFVTSSRLVIAFIVTVGVGWIVLKIRNRSILAPAVLKGARDSSAPETHVHNTEGTVTAGQGDKLVLAMRTAMRDFLDTAMYFTIGVAITAIFKAYVSPAIISIFTQNEVTSVFLMMVLAFVLSLCSTSDAFIAANFPVGLSAKLAFLTYGPMMDVKLVFMYLAVFTKKFVISLAVGLFFVIGTLCYLWINVF